MTSEEESNLFKDVESINISTNAAEEEPESITIYLIKENQLQIFETNDIESIINEQNVNQINVQNQDLLTEFIESFPKFPKENYNMIIPLSTYFEEANTNILLLKEN